MPDQLPNIHPGEVLREEFLTPLGITPYQLSKDTGLTQTQVGQIARGERSITPASALRLARYFGTSAEFWMNLQTRYDLEEQQQRLADELAAIRPLTTAA